jgi:dolichol-phosphate mannosyltransferase
MNRLSIVIPTINEAENIMRLIPEVERILGENQIDGEIIIVDDMSCDGTRDKAHELNSMYSNIRVIKRTVRDGLGNALREGVRQSKNPNILFMDADLSHDPAEIPNFLGKLEAHDIVVGSRYARGSRIRRSALRKIISWAYNLACKALLNVRVSDMTSGYRAFKRDIFQEISPRSSGPEIHSELVLCASINGYALGEIPVTYVDRETGESKLHYLAIGPAYSKVMLCALCARIKKSLNGFRR